MLVDAVAPDNTARRCPITLRSVSASRTSAGPCAYASPPVDGVPAGAVVGVPGRCEVCGGRAARAGRDAVAGA
ncbi:hypothetical protein [Streptomyces sp. MAR4 CNX-425]|uniref:hypothetical protein n=1 Tax=Streptomyces sp. MAR4 CNX-425 TaxID=3406343 RepID=UPI003B50AD96